MSKFIQSNKEIHNALFGPPREPTVKCCKCDKLFRADDESYPWEYSNFSTREKSKYFGYCRNCYIKDVNENLTENDIRRYAEQAVDSAPKYMAYHKPMELSYENWENKVLPMIKVVQEEREEAKKKAYHDEKVEEAVKIYQNARDEYLDPKYNLHEVKDAIMISIIASLLEKIDSLEKKIPPRDWMHERFTI